MKVGWEIKSFEDCIERVTYTPKIQRKDFLASGHFPIVSQEEGLVNGYWSNPLDVFSIKKPLIVFGDHTRCFKYIDFNFVLGADGVKLLQPIDEIDPKFFYFQMLSIEFDSLGYARHYRILKERKIVIPPLEEQRRIVALLDKAFAGIATATANTQQNLTNARALFESYLASAFEEAASHGKRVPLSELATDITDGDHLPPPKADVGIPFITIGNIDKRSRKINLEDAFRVSRDYFNSLKKNRKPATGDLLYTVTGSFGIPVLVEDNTEFCFQRHIGLIRPKPTTNSRWLFHILRSPQVFKQAEAGATGTAQKTVSLKVLRNISVPEIALDKQLSAVADLDVMANRVNGLELTYEAKLAALAELKQSLLQKAFAGELT